MALLEFLKSNRDIVLMQNIQQVVSNAGDGILRDDTPASKEFRQFLRQVPSESLFNYARRPPCQHS